MKKPELKTPYLWLLFFLWVAWGQFVSYCVLNGLVPEFIVGIADAIGDVVPSITRIGDNYVFGLSSARRIATLSLTMTPLLFALMLLADVEESVSGARKKGKEKTGIKILLVVGLGMFVAGFGYRIPGFPQRLFYTSDIAYSFQSSLLTYLGTLALRAAWCLNMKC